MTLADYLNAVRGAQSTLCSAIGAHSPDMSRWAAGLRPTPPDRCPSIERATGGQVTAEELRPDVRWARIPDPDWPHPAGRPCIDVAAPPTECPCFPGTCRGGDIVDGKLASGQRCKACIPVAIGTAALAEQAA